MVTPRTIFDPDQMYAGKVYRNIPIPRTLYDVTITLKAPIPISATHNRSPLSLLGTRLIGYAANPVADWEFRIDPFAHYEDRTDLLIGFSQNRVDLWPEKKNPLKFELKRVHQQAMDPPRLTPELLVALGKFMRQTLARGGAVYDWAVDGVLEQNGIELFEFKIYGVQNTRFASEKLESKNFNEVDLNVIFNVKNAIIERTTPEDILWFVGNTGAYFYEAFNKERDAHLIVFSDYPFPKGGQPPLFSAEGLQNYENKVLRPALTGQPSESKRLILIDHIETGDTIQQLVELLGPNWTNLLPERTRIYFINLNYPFPVMGAQDYIRGLSRFNIYALPNLPELKIGPDNEALARFDRGMVGRMVPNYPAQYWEVDWTDVPNPDANYARMITRQIRKRAGKRSVDGGRPTRNRGSMTEQRTSGQGSRRPDSQGRRPDNLDRRPSMDRQDRLDRQDRQDRRPPSLDRRPPSLDRLPSIGRSSLGSLSRHGSMVDDDIV
ncbi:hypothetical protein MMC11_004555 [Xylographa trunciseda]|nr:hypothetical protein [Xylographa trunciseda]